MNQSNSEQSKIKFRKLNFSKNVDNAVTSNTVKYLLMYRIFLSTSLYNKIQKLLHQLHVPVTNYRRYLHHFFCNRDAFFSVLRIRILRIRMFLGLLDPDPDPLVKGMDPGMDPALDPHPSIIKQK